jgi:prepilin-type N-terminal cleavage/methylation domain-containing protein
VKRGLCRGFTLLETLLALSLFVLTLAGTTALQVRALQNSEDASRRARAAILTADYLQRAAMTPGVSLVMDEGLERDSGGSDRGCFALGDCTAEDFARTLLRDWRWRLHGSASIASGVTFSQPTLPDAQLCIAPTGDRVAAVLSWAALSDVIYASEPSPCTDATPHARPHPRRAVTLWAYRASAM